METIKSAVKHLKASHAYSEGKELSEKELQSILKALCDYTTSEAQRIWNLNAALLEKAIAATGKRNIPYKQSFLRKAGAGSTMTPMPGALVGNLRELVEFKIISEASSWVKNPNPHKKPFRFNRNLDLSATGDAFSTIHYSQENNTVVLELRALTERLILQILLPEYVKNRRLSKLSKPRIRWNGTEYVFDFTLFEIPEENSGKLVAGVDLGKVQPYSAVVISPRGFRIASFEASRGLKRGWEKYEELGFHIAHISAKVKRKTALGLDVSVLETELERVRAKRARKHAELSKQQASELTKKLCALPVKLVHVEDLAWLAGHKGKSGKGGYWSYARQQADLQHSLTRNGISLKKKNPSYSSQKCSKCGEVLKSSGRNVWCSFCKKTLDRDFNAAMNMATMNHLKKRNWLAELYGLSETDRSQGQVGGCQATSSEATVEATLPLTTVRLAT